ncbi:CPBP family glutamic-type intramembrane protease [Sulfitobacter sp. JB4-11]|uniref:CPBP family glutamic-type intramembrane protease n=1 Tax=Sulfitobacter rhodophyticola TaxID=3238304 RepID=UPI0035179505
MSSTQTVPIRDLPTTSLVWFVLITFAITWGLIGAYILFPLQAVSLFGEIDGAHPIFFLATWSPALAAFTLVLIHGGRRGLISFVRRMLFWRISAGWIAFILILVPLVFVGGSLIKGGPVLAPLPPEGASAMFAVLAMMLFLGPVEEFGWRGLAQPLLQRHVAPFWAGMIIGAVWGLWHLPAFHLSGTVFGSWDFWPFFIGNITLGVLVTPILNAGAGGLFWPAMFHWQLINPFWPDAQPYDTWILVVVAAAVVWYNRAKMFTRHDAVAKVIPETAGPAL